MGNACGISSDQEYSEGERPPSNQRKNQKSIQGKGRKQSRVQDKEFPDFEEYKSKL